MEEETDIISDIAVEHYDELDYEIKLEDNDEICSKSLKSMKYLEEHKNVAFHASSVRL